MAGVQGSAVELPGLSVLLCPLLDPQAPAPEWFEACRDALIARSLDCLVGSPRPQLGADPTAEDAVISWVAAVTRVIREGSTRAPLVIVAVGPAVMALPALARSQRATHRSIVGYVLVDSELDTQTGPADDWPGAPVTYVRAPGSPALGWTLARLHGWRTQHADPLTAVVAAATRAAGAH